MYFAEIVVYSSFLKKKKRVNYIIKYFLFVCVCFVIFGAINSGNSNSKKSNYQSLKHLVADTKVPKKAKWMMYSDIYYGSVITGDNLF